MMNVVAISLLLTSMAMAGVWSPPPSFQQKRGQGAVAGEERVIVKGGHRTVLVEFDENGDGNTKVSISPPEEQLLSSATAAVAGVAQDAEKKVKEAVDEVATTTKETPEHVHRPRELICDAFGKCRHKIAVVLAKAKEKEAETAKDVEDGGKTTVEATVEKAKEVASRATDAFESGREKAKEVASRATDAVESGREKAKEVASKATDAVESGREKAKEAAKQAEKSLKDTATKAEESAEKAAEAAKRGGEKAKKEISDIARRGREVVCDAASWLVSRESLDSLMGMAHLLGLATGFGISVWVTFVMSHVLAGALSRQQFGMVQSKVYPVYFEAMAASIGLALVGHLLGRRRGGASTVLSDTADMLQAVNLLGSLGLVLANLWYLEPRATKVMFERMKLEKEEGRGTTTAATTTTSGTATATAHEPSRLSNTFRVADLASPVVPAATTTPTAAGTTSTPAAATTATIPTVLGRRVESEEVVRSKMARMSQRLNKLNSYSSLLNVLTLMGLSWHLVYLSQHLTC